jgi:hypothetical protein
VTEPLVVVKAYRCDNCGNEIAATDVISVLHGSDRLVYVPPPVVLCDCGATMRQEHR